MKRHHLKRLFGLLILLWGLQVSADTLVRFKTTLGDFDVQLYDRDGAERTTPLTVENFLAYVRTGVYEGSFLHRSMPGFIIQGGGFNIIENDITQLLNNGTVLNEPGNSNVRGTIAMAKLGGDPDSASNQWFFNLADNSANLDLQNDGFTVFGHVLGNGMDVVDALAAVTAYNAGGPFENLPLLNSSLLIENFLYIESISIVSFDSTQTTAANGTITLSWTATGALSVNIERATNLVTTDWQTIATNLTSGTFTDPSPPANGPAFYRVVLP